MVMFGKTISLFLIEGDPNKRWVCELSNWNGKAYKIPRIDVKRCSDRKDLASCGVYFLFGRSDSDEKGIVYIGEAENVYERLKQHDAPQWKKIFGMSALCLSAKTIALTRPTLSIWSAAVIPSQKRQIVTILRTLQFPADASLTEAEQAEMEEFLYNIRMINNVLGHKVLESLVAEEVGDTESASQILYIQARGAKCKKECRRMRVLWS